MTINNLIEMWFDKWTNGDYYNLPISENFTHTSPFGKIKGKKEYLDLVEKNKDKFLGYDFEIHDKIFDGNKACVRYTAVQGDFRLDVSEWYYVEDDMILPMRATIIRRNRKASARSKATRVGR